MKSKIILAIVILIGILMIDTVAARSTKQLSADALKAAALVGAAGIENAPVEDLKIGYQERFSLPVTNKQYTLSKVINGRTGGGYDVAQDSDGNVVDYNGLRGKETAAYKQTYGTMHPKLHQALGSADSDQKIKVSIWLKTRGKSAAIDRQTPKEARSLSRNEIRAQKAAGLNRARSVHREAEQPLIDSLKSKGFDAKGDDLAPMVTAELPAAVIREVAALPQVDAIDMLVEGGPESSEKTVPTTGGPEAPSGRSTVKADVVEGRGINGSGIDLAVVEGDAVSNANPYLNNGTHAVTHFQSLAVAPIDDHATAVGGFMGSTHATVRGTAPSIAEILSANSGGWGLADYQPAVTWALGAGASALNNSYYLEIDGAMHNSDRWADYIVRNYADVFVKSAGNRGDGDDFVTSPGLGYNVLTVGAINDMDTSNWSDDTMASLSSSVEPAGREKPDVAAVGSTNWPTSGMTGTTIASPWTGGVGSGTSYAAPAVTGMVATLTQRDAGLESWPEAVKAITIASALHNIEGSSRISELDGAGAVDMAAADYIAANARWSGQSVNGSSFTDQKRTITTINLSAGERFRAALAFDSNPSADYTSDPLEGDLDLYLYDAGGTLVASSSGVDSWEVIDWTVPTTGNYTLVVYNWGNTLSSTESTYIGVAWWPGHYKLETAIQTRGTPTSARDHYVVDAAPFTDWMAVAIRPPAGADYDLSLYDNSQYGNPADFTYLASSWWGGSTVDIVAIDRNHAPAKNYYPVVSTWAGAGNYDIQRAIMGGTITNGSSATQTTTPLFVSEVWDIGMTAGVTKYFGIVPGSGNADLGGAVFDSDPASSGSLYAGRGTSFDSAGAGGAEYFTHTTAVSDQLGLVVFNKQGQVGNTSWKLYVDETAPTGSVLINSGVAYTARLAVTLRPSASDSQTGVAKMRFANEGGPWSAWEPYTTSKAWSLSAGGAGLRTVYAEFMNKAGQPSGTVSDSITLAPDLQVPTLTAPAAASAGTTITVTDKVLNASNVGAPASIRGMYLSTDSVLGLTDTLINTRGVPALGADASNTASVATFIPAGVPTGAYYLIAKADSPGAVVEASESNNTRSRAIRIGPDLTVPTLSVPAKAAVGGLITVTDTVKNISATMGAGASTTGIYLSTNSALDAADTLLGVRPVPALGPGASNVGSGVYALPITPVGRYYIIAKTDNANVVFEASETNNIRAGTIYIGPDLVVSSLTAPATAVSGSTISITDATKDDSPMAVGASTTGYYLSTNTVLDAGDILFGGRAVPALGPGASHTLTSSQTLPGVAPGVWYIIAKADNPNAILESLETNNTRSRAITITP